MFSATPRSRCGVPSPIPFRLYIIAQLWLRYWRSVFKKRQRPSPGHSRQQCGCLWLLFRPCGITFPNLGKAVFEPLTKSKSNCSTQSIDNWTLWIFNVRRNLSTIITCLLNIEWDGGRISISLVRYRFVGLRGMQIGCVSHPSILRTGRA